MLIEAIEYRRTELIKILLNSKHIKNLGIGTLIGTPAHFCIKNLMIEPSFFKQMLKAGMNPNSTDANGKTPINLAFSYYSRDKLKFEKICKMFLKAG